MDEPFDSSDDGYVSIGPREYLDRLLAEYGLTEDEARDAVRVRPAPYGMQEYLVHASMLRSQGEFPCAGDAEALEFCREVAEALAADLGVTREEAVAQVNRHWSDNGPDPKPRVWIVGLEIAYHELPEYWAERIREQGDAPAPRASF
ncbi:hypothetical protein GCM10009678_13710 [Actinomadura kijaniata]|uniref:Uncharacterized protein YjiS (DUF1127 family) n=1 Tax=Actinomadura namibiensis TaxID=182080 RepID=A0A7W3QMG6_ACTNM|nr:hypothetical protein [Actinomadura namibiensis]MBA8952540.1 uncharacterized protein YjiS (DUF1127 family) [Actinomadura namibiensis]